MTDTVAVPRRRAPLRNTLGEVVEVADDELGAPRASNAGRLVVVSGQTIASAWGNTTYDQTCQVFATSADRTNQWPAPLEGAMSWLADSGTPWQYRAGAWHGVPLGFVASVVGPATQVDCAATPVTVISMPAPLVAGRYYRVSAQALLSQQNAVGTPLAQLVDSATYTPGIRVVYWSNLAVTVAASGSGVWTFAATSSGSVTFSIKGSANTGTARFSVNASQITVEDIGS